MATVPEIRIYSPSGSYQDGSHLSRPLESNASRITLLISGETTQCSPGDSLIISPSGNNLNNIVPWKNTFQMRLNNLGNFPPSTLSYRTTYRAQALAMQRVKSGCITSSVKSLDILRQNLQKSMNKEIDEVIQKYLEKFFKPAIENIKFNNGSNAVSEEHIRAVCRQVLEEAKKLYDQSVTRGSSPAGDLSDCDSYTHSESRLGSSLRLLNKAQFRRRKESDTDSEASQIQKPKRKKGRPPLHGNSSGRSTPSKANEPVKKDGPKWDPSRLTKETVFVMGAKANKALGLGATRGRLYIKHPALFRYSGDQDDKQWLYDNNLMPATGGKAYMLIAEDIRELAETEEYKNNPGLMMNEITGFNVPEFMINKMKIFMKSSRTDNAPIPTVAHRKRGRPPGSTNKTHIQETSIKIENNQVESNEKKQEFEPYFNFSLPQSSEAPSPSEDLELLGVETQSTGQTSPFSNPPTSFDVSPMTVPSIGISPTPSELSAALDPPLSASFDVTTSP